jgi:CRISPR/Cas system CSM-associated protein Csm3 (group 7 of RAMP superfamily)
VAQDKDGYLYIPGSTLKGSLRNQLYDLQRAMFPPENALKERRRDPHRDAEDLIEFKPKVNLNNSDFTHLIFGTRFIPCTLFFDDAHLVETDKAYFDGPDEHDKKMTKRGTTGIAKSDEAEKVRHNKEYLSKQTVTRTQVHISRLTRTAEGGMLFTSEFGLKGLNFDGRIYGRLSGVPVPTTEANYTYSLVMFLASVKALSRLGGNKSTGGGEVKCSSLTLTVDEISVDPETVLNALTDLQYYPLALEEVQP